MSRLLKQEQQLAATRVEHRRRAGATQADPAKPSAPVLLLTHQPLSEPLSPTLTPTFVRWFKLWLRPGARWALLGAAACGGLLVVSATSRRPLGVAGLPPHEAFAALTQHPSPTLFPAPHAPAGEAPSSRRRSQIDPRQRAQEMELALAEAQRVMVLMEEAMRQAAQAYVSASAPAGSSSGESSRPDTNS